VRCPQQSDRARYVHPFGKLALAEALLYVGDRGADDHVWVALERVSRLRGERLTEIEETAIGGISAKLFGQEGSKETRSSYQKSTHAEL
jgi:hypothetical protein